MKKLLLIDAYAMIYRAFHALPPMSNKAGVPTNAVYGFFMILQKTITLFQPSHIVVCFDTAAPTFRKELYKEYRATRKEPDPTLIPQFDLVEKLLEASGIKCIGMPGYEADDVIGSVATQFRKDFDSVFILTGDKDLLQLSDKKTNVIFPKKGVSEFTLYTPEEVKNKLGVDPGHVADYKALAGDASDNYNTAKGIGPKSALALLAQYPTVEELLEHTDEIKNEKWRAILVEYKDTILLFKKLATIVCDLEMNVKVDDMEYTGFGPNLEKELDTLQLYSLKAKLFSLPAPVKEKPVKPVKKVEEKTTKDQMDLFTN
ncbi:MAG: 5'-3' exonuclease H3TH domain-containing protein [Weeksellaceae bacterium]